MSLKPGVEQVEQLARRLGEIPTLAGPAAAALEAALLAGEDARSPAARDFIEIVAADPAMTVRLLSLANAASPQPATSAADAVERLGLPAARWAIIALPACDIPVGPVHRSSFWRHAIASACAARIIARLAGEDEALAFTCGLLHDIGKLAFAQAAPKSYARIVDTVADRGGDIAAIERELLGGDHCLLAHRLAAAWHLAPLLANVLWLHHQAQLPDLPSGHARMIHVVRLADTLARRGGIGFSGNFTFPETLATQAQRLGLAEAAVEAAAATLGDEVEQYANRLRLDAPDGTAGPASDSDAVTARALQQMNRLNDSLERRCHALSGRATAFDQLNRFIASLSPQAAVTDVLAAIAAGLSQAASPVQDPRTAGGAEPACAVAYSLVEGGQEVLATCWPDRGGAKTLVSFVAPELNPAPPAAAAAAEAMAEVLADPAEIGPWLDLSQYTHRPLLCAGRWIGGVLLPAAAAPAGEALHSMLAAMTMALAIVQSRSQAVRLSERLAAATQSLAATQDALAEGKALAAVGEMAGGAAHEINNPLAVISGRAQLMREKSTDEKDRKIWQTIAEQAQRISDIITDLMDYASPPPPQKEAAKLENLLKSAADAFAKSDHPQAAAATVDISVAGDAPAAYVDARQIESVLIELLSNAAMAGGAACRIRIGARWDEVNGWALITVADDGPGMDAPTLAGAFAPFFSRQRAGRRRGMGLPRAKRYVENNGGRIWIRSEANKGTNVYVQLPPAR